jgi:hypothetical protein
MFAKKETQGHICENVRPVWSKAKFEFIEVTWCEFLGEMQLLYILVKSEGTHSCSAGKHLLTEICGRPITFGCHCRGFERLPKSPTPEGTYMKAPKAFRATHLDDQTPFPESLQDIRSFLNLFKPMRQRGHGPDVGEERT